MQQTSALISTLVLMALPALIVAVAIRKARGTTLMAPLAWALIAYLILNFSAVSLHVSPGPDANKWTYIVSTAAFCPMVALFGAKRPQNRAWQLIVFAFWFVLALPAIQSLLMHRGEPFDLHDVWRWFLVILIVAGGVNYLPTRFVWASMFLTLGQMLLFWYYLPWSAFLSAQGSLEAGIVLFIIGISLAFLSNRRTGRQLAPYHGWNRTWRDFRDFYGAVWGLRIMERVNSLPAAVESGVRLYWDGFYEVRPSGGHDNCNPKAGDGNPLPDEAPPLSDSIEIHPASPDVVAPLDAGLRSLLRRFVSNDWLEARLQSDRK